MSTKSNQEKPVLAIITGVSGAGKSTAMKALEDLSFRCIDNIPIELLEPTTRFFLSRSPAESRFALGLDLRDQASLLKFKALKPSLESLAEIELLFLICDKDVLVQRYSTTRRKHPFIKEKGDLMTAIEEELNLLAPLRGEARAVFDTSHWSPHYLARSLESHFSYAVKGRALYVTITSFGFKNGAFSSAESVYDVRFLKNPYFIPSLKHKSGLEQEVIDCVLSDEKTQDFLEKLVDLNAFLLPHYHREGKHYLRVGIGCTGGMHRSVVIAETLGRRLKALNLPSIAINVAHRDLPST